MSDQRTILRLYENVLDDVIRSNQIHKNDVRAGILGMNHAYAPTDCDFKNAVLPNFNDVAYRYAYLLKYAPLHTYAVFDLMLQILEFVPELFENLLKSDIFKLCSLGAGPGCDVIGVLAALRYKFGYFHSSVTLVDCMEEWRNTFSLVIDELKSLEYGDFCYLFEKMRWSFYRADLLGSMPNKVNNAIQRASFITMVKFISATASNDRKAMVERIFRILKPGALVLFVDNAGGGYTELVEEVAEQYNFNFPILPSRHLKYLEDDLKTQKFHYVSCFKTKVSVLCLQKPMKMNEQLRHLTSYPDKCHRTSEDSQRSKRKRSSKRRRRQRCRAVKTTCLEGDPLPLQYDTEDDGKKEFSKSKPIKDINPTISGKKILQLFLYDVTDPSLFLLLSCINVFDIFY